MFHYHTLWTLIAVSFSAVLTAPLNATPPLHEQIDALIEVQPGFDASAADPADDAMFLRRVYLDLSGCIPNATEVRAFLSDPSPEKRTQTIDALLASPQHATRMQYVLDELLMERRSGKHVAADEWRTFLRQSVLENKPWDALVRELLSADGSQPETRPAAKFLLDRELQRDEVTRDLGRIFLGRDLQCAQCHDHPTVDDYLQRHYFGLTAFITRSYLFKDPKTGVTSIGEKAKGDVKFTSVFTSETAGTAPRMLNLPPLADPPAEKELYKVKLEKNVRGVPVYSRREQLAIAMTDDANQAFRENIANRMWALMMGRGLVEPLDMMHAQNPATHPQVLELLADSLLQHDYDLRDLLRELALTRTYQRSSQAVENRTIESQSLEDRTGDVTAEDDHHYSVGRLKPLSPEQLAWSMMQATGVIDVELAETDSDATPIDDAVQKHIETFAKVFGAAGQSTQFDAAADQALFLRNGNLIHSWLTVKNGLVASLQKLDDPQLAKELYLRVFSRMPNEQETSRVADFLNSSSDRTRAIQQLTWASLVSTEFRFNH